MAQSAPLLVVGRRVGTPRERRQQVTHVATVKTDTLDHIGQSITILTDISVSVAFHALDVNR